jgi:FMN phosphatase YigB (HAD superfamily)
MILIVDVDGTIADTITAWRMAVWEAYRVVIYEHEIDQFDAQRATYNKVKISSCYPPNSEEEYDDFLYKRCFWNPEFYRSLLPLEGLWEALLGWDGPVIYLTTRHPKLQIETEAWLSRWGFLTHEESQVVLMKDKHTFIEEVARAAIEDKEEIVFIDDKLKTMVNVSALSLPNVRCYVPLRPWNDPKASVENAQLWSKMEPKAHVEILPDHLIAKTIYGDVQ